jgi:hypothetical protein
MKRMTIHGWRLRMLALTMPVAAVLATACSPVQVAAAGGATARPSSASPLASSTGVCGSGQTCYTPQQLQAAYGVKPLLDRGIDGRGETVVLPELAESQLNRPRSPICARIWLLSTASSVFRPRG